MKPPPTSSSSTSNLIRKARLSPYLFTLLAFILFVTVLYGQDLGCILGQFDLDVIPNRPLPTPKKHYKKLPFTLTEKESGCDIFRGKWVWDPLNRPLYQESECPYIQPQLTCQEHGRPDRDYQFWRWQPDGCSLPSFNASLMLETLRNKRMMFVGDSLNRGQYVSMVCLLHSLIPDDAKSMETFGSLTVFTAKEYNATIYFSEEFLKSLFQENGFSTEECGVCCKQVENRSREIVMNRRWLQAAFRLNNDNLELPKVLKEPEDGFDVDISEGFAFDMFGISSSRDEIMELKFQDWNFKIKLLSKEFQHTCKSTGLMLWESARLMASVLASNQTIVSGKRVLELGSGCGGICSMIACKTARLVVPTDGDNKALELLKENVSSNLDKSLSSKLHIRQLNWGNKEHIESVKKLSDNKGFDVIIGTDVTYVAEAIMPLFQTAKELISSSQGDEEGLKPAFILCHIFRRVDEESLLSAASCFGFELVDTWPSNVITENPYRGTINSWFEGRIKEDDIENPALNIMYFHAK